MNGESTNEDWANCATGQMGIEIAFAAGQMEIGPMVQLDRWGFNWLVLLQLKQWGLDQ